MFCSIFTGACVHTSAGGSPLRGLRRRSSQLVIWAEIWLHGFWAALWFTWRCLAWGTCSLGRCGRDSFCCSFPLFVRAFLFEYFAERLEGGWRSVHRRPKTRCGRCSDPLVVLHLYVKIRPLPTLLALPVES